MYIIYIYTHTDFKIDLDTQRRTPKDRKEAEILQKIEGQECSHISEVS